MNDIEIAVITVLAFLGYIYFASWAIATAHIRYYEFKNWKERWHGVIVMFAIWIVFALYGLLTTEVF